MAEFRQKWIDNVIATLSECHAILITREVGGVSSLSDARTLRSLRTKLEILLNPSEDDTVALLSKLDEVERATADSERRARSDQMVSVARGLLKREWVRLKTELTDTDTR